MVITLFGNGGGLTTLSSLVLSTELGWDCKAGVRRSGTGGGTLTPLLQTTLGANLLPGPASILFSDSWFTGGRETTRITGVTSD